MTLIEEVKKHKYVGLPFHAVGFPQPVYTHLTVSNDGINWEDLQTYGMGWRDVDIAYINDEFWTCTGTNVDYTTDFEEFTRIQCPNMGLKNLWASEFTQDSAGNWWFVYCGSLADVDYSYFKLYASRVYPEQHYIDAVRNDITLNVSGGYIDPNINYINGYYYLWCSKTSTPTQELHLFRSKNILGPYDEVQTNIMDLTKNAGFTWNEAPEMDIVDGKFYLYSDPWNHGQSESARNVYRAESADMVTWSNMQKINCDVTLRHFTPLYIGDINFDTGNNGETDTPNQELTIISLWNGNVNDLYTTNRNNYLAINNFITNWNTSNNPFIEPITFKLNADNVSENNRAAYNQLVNNATLLITELPKLVESYRITDYDYVCTPPLAPDDIFFNQAKINTFWKWVSDTLNWIENQIKQVA